MLQRSASVIFIWFFHRVRELRPDKWKEGRRDCEPAFSFSLSLASLFCPFLTYFLPLSIFFVPPSFLYFYTALTSKP